MHLERHSIERVGWLRAAVLGANDGIVSTASLVLGVASANTSSSGILLAGVAGLVAGAMSMATGEYVSVSSQVDTENAALAQEKGELENDFQGETQELTALYIKRGLNPTLAREVAEQLMEKDALGAHAREELGLTETNSAQPLQAALFSAVSFSVGAILPLNRCVVSAARLYFCIHHSYHAFFTCYSWLYFFGSWQCISGKSHNKNYFLECHGNGLIDWCWAFRGSEFDLTAWSEKESKRPE